MTKINQPSSPENLESHLYLEEVLGEDALTKVREGHARKMAARLEDMGYDFLYYENIDGGHSAAANLKEAAKQRALEYTYLLQKLRD